MGGCQSAADSQAEEPHKLSMPKENKFKKLEKHKFDFPGLLDAKV